VNVASVLFEGQAIRGYLGTGGLLVMLNDLPDIFPASRPAAEFQAEGYGAVTSVEAIVAALVCDPRKVRRSYYSRLLALYELLEEEGALHEAALAVAEADFTSPQLIRVRDSMAD
jgi:hypothetical protein